MHAAPRSACSQHVGSSRAAGEGAVEAMLTVHRSCAASPDRSAWSTVLGIAGSKVSSKARAGHAWAAVLRGKQDLR